MPAALWGLFFYHRLRIRKKTASCLNGSSESVSPDLKPFVQQPIIPKANAQCFKGPVIRKCTLSLEFCALNVCVFGHAGKVVRKLLSGDLCCHSQVTCVFMVTITNTFTFMLGKWFIKIAVETFPSKAICVNLTVALEEKSKDHPSRMDASSEKNECLYQISCQGVRPMLRYFTWCWWRSMKCQPWQSIQWLLQVFCPDQILDWPTVA